MGRIVAIDYGQKRVGIAVTDPGKIIASALTTVHAKDILVFLQNYLEKEEVEGIVVGEARQEDDSPSHSAQFIEPFVKKLRKTFPAMLIERMDERYTSQMAREAMIQGGMKKKDRQKKENVDAISATIILQSYMEQPNRKF
jgi:putative Holliday junction resolvase